MAMTLGVRAGALLVAVLRLAYADILPIGSAAGNYAVLYSGLGGMNLSITNVTINGNVGVGNNGTVSFSGPGTIGGRLDFAASETCTPNCAQYSNSNGSNVGPTSVNYKVIAVTTALSDLATLQSEIVTAGGGMGAGTPEAFTNAGETINENTGALENINGVMTRVFDVTSYTAVNSSVLTIVGDGSEDPVIFNFDFASNVNLSGTVVLSGTGLTSPDQVLFNFQTSGKQINLNNNGENAFIGDLLAPNDQLGLTHATLDGRVLGGDTQNMQIVSGDTINAPAPIPPVPEPASIALLGTVLLLGGMACRHKQRAEN
jgi:hypothetical protein